MIKHKMICDTNPKPAIWLLSPGQLLEMRPERSELKGGKYIGRQAIGSGGT